MPSTAPRIAGSMAGQITYRGVRCGAERPHVTGPRSSRPDGRRPQTRLTEAEETLRAIRHGEVDALVVQDSSPAAQVFTLSSADRPYRMFVENMRDGAATVSEAGHHPVRQPPAGRAAGVPAAAGHRLADRVVHRRRDGRPRCAASAARRRRRRPAKPSCSPAAGTGSRSGSTPRRWTSTARSCSASPLPIYRAERAEARDRPPQPGPGRPDARARAGSGRADRAGHPRLAHRPAQPQPDHRPPHPGARAGADG